MLDHNRMAFNKCILEIMTMIIIVIIITIIKHENSIKDEDHRC